MKQGMTSKLKSGIVVCEEKPVVSRTALNAFLRIVESLTQEEQIELWKELQNDGIIKE